MDTIVVNLFGEPSAGKSTCAMDITAKLKRNGIIAAMGYIRIVGKILMQKVFGI